MHGALSSSTTGAVPGRYSLNVVPLAETPAAVKVLFDLQRKPEGSWAWFHALATTTVGNNQIAEVAILYENSLPLAAVPLLRDRNGLRGLTAPYTTCFQPPFGSVPESFGALLGTIVTGRFGLEALDLSEPAAVHFLNGLSKGGLVGAEYSHFANWYEPVTDFSDYWNARSGRLRSTVQRKMARLTKANRIDFETIDLARESQRGIDLFQSIYEKSWKSAEPDPGFIPTCCNELGKDNLISMVVAWIDKKPAAAQIWLLAPSHATIFKLAHDPLFDSHSVGTLLTYWQLEQLSRKVGALEIDFGRGNDEYKREWLRSCRYRHGFIGYPRTMRGLYGIFSEVLPTKLASYIRSK